MSAAVDDAPSPELAAARRAAILAAMRMKPRHRGHYFTNRAGAGWTCTRCGIGNQAAGRWCLAPAEPVNPSRQTTGPRQETRTRASSASKNHQVGSAPRPGADLLERGICSRGHTIASVYELEIHADAIRCARCVDEAAGRV